MHAECIFEFYREEYRICTKEASTEFRFKFLLITSLQSLRPGSFRALSALCGFRRVRYWRDGRTGCHWVGVVGCSSHVSCALRFSGSVRGRYVAVAWDSFRFGFASGLPLLPCFLPRGVSSPESLFLPAAATAAPGAAFGGGAGLVVGCRLGRSFSSSRRFALEVCSSSRLVVWGFVFSFGWWCGRC